MNEEEASPRKSKGVLRELELHVKNRPYLCGYGESHDKQEKCIREIFEWYEGLVGKTQELSGYELIPKEKLEKVKSEVRRDLKNLGGDLAFYVDIRKLIDEKALIGGNTDE